MALKNSKNTSTQSARNFEPAIAFVNFGLPTRDGTSIRLIALPLVESNETHKQLADYLSGADLKEAERTAKVLAERVANVKSRITLDVGYPRSEEERQLAL